MLKHAIFTAACAAALCATVLPARAEMSADGKKLMEITSVGIAAGLCGIAIPDDVAKRLNDGMATYAEKQQDMTPAQYADATTASAAEMASAKEMVCGALKQQGIAAVTDSVLR